jgi:hypothetical protein
MNKVPTTANYAMTMLARAIKSSCDEVTAQTMLNDISGALELYAEKMESRGTRLGANQARVINEMLDNLG